MPLAKTSLEFAQQEYNGMLIGVYDLLDEVREQIEAGKDYVETLRDYWIAEAELTGAVGGSLPQQPL
jgi:cobalt-zinc-cadmium efflux system outer membrane protein